MLQEAVIFKKHVIKGRNSYYLEYSILEKDGISGIKIESTLSNSLDSKTIFPIQMTKEETLNFIRVLSENLVFPISLTDIYEDYIYE